MAAGPSYKGWVLGYPMQESSGRKRYTPLDLYGEYGAENLGDEPKTYKMAACDCIPKYIYGPNGTYEWMPMGDCYLIDPHWTNGSVPFWGEASTMFCPAPAGYPKYYRAMGSNQTWDTVEGYEHHPLAGCQPYTVPYHTSYSESAYLDCMQAYWYNPPLTNRLTAWLGYDCLPQMRLTGQNPRGAKMWDKYQNCYQPGRHFVAQDNAYMQFGRNVGDQYYGEPGEHLLWFPLYRPIRKMDWFEYAYNLSATYDFDDEEWTVSSCQRRKKMTWEWNNTTEEWEVTEAYDILNYGERVIAIGPEGYYTDSGCTTGAATGPSVWHLDIDDRHNTFGNRTDNPDPTGSFSFSNEQVCYDAIRHVSTTRSPPRPFSLEDDNPPGNYVWTTVREIDGVNHTFTPPFELKSCY